MRTLAPRTLLFGLSLCAACMGGCKDEDDPEAAGGSQKAISSKDGGPAYELCGSVVCRAGRQCCNESCGICTAADVACSAQICKRGDGVTALAPECGGDPQRPCPGDGRCVSAEGAACDPSDRGCGGTCECAREASCPAGTHWNGAAQVCGCELDANSGNGDRNGGGGGDDARDSGTGSGDGTGGDPGGSGGGNADAGSMTGGGAGGSGGEGGNGGSGGGGSNVTCGDAICASGQVCCNESCSLCAPPGTACTQEVCTGGGGSGAPVPCGSTSCASGQLCCDPSCGLCANTQTECAQLSCTDPGPHPGDPCSLQCPAGQRCEYVAVTCVSAPCPPEPQCVPYTGCGGLTGAGCPGAGSCVDDASDDCDPRNGGSDCPGVRLCALSSGHSCTLGWIFDFSPDVCACTPEIINCIPETPCIAGL